MKRSVPVTVVIPVYNDTRGYLGECLSSLVAQTHQEWEAIVVDDGSISGNAETTVHLKPDSRIRYVRHAANRGLSAARNTGIKNARCELVAMVDSDDRLSPDFLAVLSNALEQSDSEAVFGDFVLFGDREGSMSFIEAAEAGEMQTWNLQQKLESHFLGVDAGKRSILWNAPSDLLEPHLLLRFLLPPGPGVLIRRSSLDRVGGYCEADILRLGMEDLDFWLTAACCAATVSHISRPLYYYRQHAESMISRVARHQYRIHEFVSERHSALFQRLGLREAYLAAGYRRSARAAWFQGMRLSAVQMALRSLYCSPMNAYRALRARSIAGQSSTQIR